MEEALIGRLMTLMSHYELTTNAFAKKSNLDSSHYARMLKGELSITKKTLDKICTAFPEINFDWLKKGEGEMLKTKVPEKPETEDPYLIPLIPDSALAGPLPDFSSPVVRDRCERVHVPVPDCDFAIQISGDSMAPEYKPGDYVAVSRINDRRFIPYSTPLLLDTTEGAVLKCLEPGDDPDCLSAVSLNPHYLPYPIPKDLIRGIYRIKAVIRIIKTM
ncbi:MAG: helix-turn-helix domain-containing protein [Muribaculaceae bacterium]|nr:helix-turn-helix domain-containing protein [Muribaculaceae bacterium]